MASGWRPYSVKIGDEYVSYRRADPLSTMVGAMADIQDMTDEKQKEYTTGAVLSALTENLSDKTFFKGIIDLSMAIEYRNLGRSAGQVAGGFVPALVNQVRQGVDPVQRETEGFLDTVANRIPGVSETLEPKLDVFGEPVRIDESLGPDFLSPLAYSRDSKDPVRQLLGDGIMAGKPSNRIQGKGLPRGGVELTDKEYSWFVRKQGRIARAQLERIVRSPEFRRLDMDQQQAIVNRVFDAARLPFRQQLKLRHMQAQ